MLIVAAILLSVDFHKTRGNSPIFVLYGLEKSILSLIPMQIQLLKKLFVSGFCKFRGEDNKKLVELVIR
jgi:hypothetical protein